MNGVVNMAAGKFDVKENQPPGTERIEHMHRTYGNTRDTPNVKNGKMIVLGDKERR